MGNVLDWLEATADRLPDKTAVADPDASLTWGELRARARAAGSWVAAHDGEPADGGRRAVALYLEKTPDALACMLGAAYAGDFYSVLDVRQPASRIHAICDRLDPAVVLTDAANAEAAREAFAGTRWEPVDVSVLLSAPEDPAALAARRAAAIDVDPLYVNFTSGSTGTPKGVVVSQRSVLDFIPVFCRTFGIGEDDVLANQAPFDFDVSVKDIYSCLLTGAELRIVPRPYFSQPAALMDYLADSGATTLVWAVSALCFVSIMRGLDYRVPDRVDKVLFSGEVMPPKQLRAWRRALPGATYVNLYGPTEITCNCTYQVLEDRDYADGEPIPVGRPFPNERVVLLDEGGREVPTPARGGEPGELGEICVSGTALGLGYLGDPGRTAEAFAQSPLNGRWLEPLYRTGDLGRYGAGGELYYVSRKDFQVKHMGQRIELGDIEVTAQGVAGVERACCVYDARRKKIRLFYQGDIDQDGLLARLRDLLPSYMAPAAVRRLDALPLTKNGKVDRAALAAMR